jgi:phosphoribosylanthranilate isomerase
VTSETVRVKICGITRPADALAAVEAGADAIGLMFYERSRRWVTPGQARSIAEAVPGGISRVGVFVDADDALIDQAIKACNLDTLQFHGDESPAFCNRFKPLKVWKAFRVASADVLRVTPKYETDAWLLDAAVSGLLGGSGQHFDWEIAVKAKALGRPIILAGGLRPDNVWSAVERVRPYAVDVSSGVESAPGVKDAVKVRAFIAAAKGVASGSG